MPSAEQCVKRIHRYSEKNDMLHLVDHPLIRHKLTLLRKKETGTKEFRENLNEIAGLMAYEITRDVPVREVQIETPLVHCAAHELSRNLARLH